MRCWIGQPSRGKVVIGVVGTMLVFATPAQARPMGYDGDLIAFETYRGGNAEIYAAAADGSGGVVNLTKDPQHQDRRPAWKARPAPETVPGEQDCDAPPPARTDHPTPPTAHLLAFDSDREGGDADVFILDAMAARSGTSPVTARNLTPGDPGNDTAPAWEMLRDGNSLIAYTSDVDGDREIYLRYEDGSGVVSKVTDNTVDDANPDWSSYQAGSGQQAFLAFESTRGGTRQIYVVQVKDADGTIAIGPVHQATRGDRPKHQPSWYEYKGLDAQSFPHQLAYSVEQGGRRFLDVAEHEEPTTVPPPVAPFSDPGVIDVFGLTGDPGDDDAPAWSPVGANLLYASTAGGGQRDIYVMRGNNNPFEGPLQPLVSAAAPLAPSAADDTNPDWQTYKDCAEMHPNPPRPAPVTRTARPGGGGGGEGGGTGGGGGGGGAGGGGGSDDRGGSDGSGPRPRCSIRGGRRSDTLRGTRRRDVICGGGGNDRIYGAGGNDRIYGDAGNDRIYGESGNDRLLGGTGRDRISGGSGRDVMAGESGNDTLSARDRKRDSVSGGPGFDRATVDRGDRVRGVERRQR